MAAEEIAVVHVAEEEVVVSPSSKVDIVMEKEKRMEDLPNGANGRIVKEDSEGDGDGDGDGSYVFVNGNEVGNGDPVELDIERNCDGIGREDRGAEDLESERELESESDLVKDLEGKVESCKGIADQDDELFHVEAPVCEQKPESDPVTELAVSGDSCDKQEVISDCNGGFSKENEDSGIVVADDFGCNGNGLANDGIEDIVADFRLKENEGSAVADGVDCSGNGLANDYIEDIVVDSSSKDNEDSVVVVVTGDVGFSGKDSIEDIVVDARLKENENSEIVVADDVGCNGNGLANDCIGGVFMSKETKDSVADCIGCNENSVTNDSIEDTVVQSISKRNEDSLEETVVSSSSKENEESEVAVADDAVCNGNGLINGSIEDTVVHSRSKENETGIDVLADEGDHNADVKETVSEGSFDTSNIDARASSVSGKSDVREEDSVSEAVLADKHNGVLVSVPVSDDRNGDSLPVDDENTDDGLDVSNDSNGVCLSIDAENTEQNGYLVKSEAVLVDAASSNETMLADAANGNGTVLADASSSNITMLTDASSGNETVIADASSGNEAVLADASSGNEAPLVDASGNEAVTKDASSGNEAVLVDLSSGNETVLADAEPGNETVLADAEPDNETVLADAEPANEIVLADAEPGNETVLADAEPGNETLLADAEFCNETVLAHAGSVTETVLPDASSGSETVLADAASGNRTVNETHVEVIDTHLDERAQDSKLETEVIKSDENNRSSDSCDVEISREDVFESGSVAHEPDSSCLANGLKSVTEIISDSSEVVEVSNGFTVSDSLELVALDNTNKKVAVSDIQNNSNLAASPSCDEKAPESVEYISNCDNNDNEISHPVTKEGIQFGSVFAPEEPEGLDEIRRSPFYYLIRVPRYDDESLREKIRLAQIRVDEKTQSRDAIRIEMQSQKAILKECQNEFDAAVSQEREARMLIKAKRMELESIQSVINIEDIGAKIRNMEHMIQHETLPLKDEKQFIREINQLKQTQDRLNKSKKDEVQEGVDQKVQIEERLKSLKKEIEQLKVNLMKAEAVTKAAKKKLHDESDKTSKLVDQFKAADGIRQEAYVQLHSLKKESYEKNKYFWQYRDNSKKAFELGSKSDKEAVQNLCLEHEKKLRDLWSNNDEFRKEYARRNVRSTLWRLGTLDGRRLGPDEKPPVIPQVVNVRVTKDHTVSSSTLKEQQTQEKVAVSEAEKPNDKPVVKAVEQKKHTGKLEKSLKSVPQATTGLTSASIEDKIEEAVAEEKPKRTKEEEEAARKAEELRKEEEAAKLREQRRLEEKAKAKEAVERKRRIAEKAQARAALRAQKEAEEKEKEREKRAKKKERRKVSATSSVGDASITEETTGSAATSGTPTETAKETEIKEKPATTAKRSQKPSQFTKQIKAKSSIPPPLRNRGKKRMQAWMWVLLTALAIFALFLIGNYNFSSNLGRQSFNI